LRLFAVAAAALAAAALTACGTESSTREITTATAGAGASVSASPAPSDNGVAALPAAEIIGKAKAALVAAESFRYAGKVMHDDVRSGR
jgi:hypothetical protein